MTEGINGLSGTTGTYGPNDQAYIDSRIRKAAEQLVYATGYGIEIDRNHPITKALKELAKVDKEYAKYANLEHDPKLFKGYKHS